MTLNRLLETLDAKAIAYELIHHEPADSALRAAASTHTPGAEFAKAVVVWTESGPTLAVLPAPRRVDLARFGSLIGARQASLAQEGQLRGLFPDCELGAEPPLGHLYGMPVYVDRSLTGNEHITFNAGRHDEAVRLRYADFERLEHPVVGEFSQAP